MGGRVQVESIKLIDLWRHSVDIVGNVFVTTKKRADLKPYPHLYVLSEDSQVVGSSIAL
jgi:hypothetical protein